MTKRTDIGAYSKSLSGSCHHWNRSSKTWTTATATVYTTPEDFLTHARARERKRELDIFLFLMWLMGGRSSSRFQSFSGRWYNWAERSVSICMHFLQVYRWIRTRFPNREFVIKCNISLFLSKWSDYCQRGHLTNLPIRTSFPLKNIFWVSSLSSFVSLNPKPYYDFVLMLRALEERKHRNSRQSVHYHTSEWTCWHQRIRHRHVAPPVLWDFAADKQHFPNE
jgi:hypothetical protein